MIANESPGRKPDGRLHRSVVTRRRIVEAMTALIYEGHIAPTAEQVAERAQVGLRTVFRHFDDMDSLIREIGEDLDAQVQPLHQLRMPGPSGQERLLQSIAVRAEVYNRVAALHLAAQAHRHTSAYLSQRLMDAAARQRALVRRNLSDELVAREPGLLAALEVALSIDTWIRLRREQGLASDAAAAVVRRLVEGLFRGLAPGD